VSDRVLVHRVGRHAYILVDPGDSRAIGLVTLSPETRSTLNLATRVAGVSYPGDSILVSGLLRIPQRVGSD
jgi:hypothetical protein